MNKSQTPIGSEGKAPDIQKLLEEMTRMSEVTEREGMSDALNSEMAGAMPQLLSHISSLQSRIELLEGECATHKKKREENHSMFLEAEAEAARLANENRKLKGACTPACKCYCHTSGFSGDIASHRCRSSLSPS